ncbi:MAG: hypothetical protein HON47_03830 [Candidatus Diapherotrites archaeon]|uniref:Uncharacterized protein n=1 Tax=Candidatus Iainarchaeum sp. TaxID=3101447 RepID=A0A8T5GG36_9ARCH|nr:hypothetical protein [Candidatus Diapherotrites archaeon]MBT7241141.1 hypothetical protein [Candidatus Diapherotrites archaeon]
MRIKQLILVLTIVLLLFGFVSAGDCASTYFKSTACGNVSPFFSQSNYIHQRSDNAWTSTGELDWNNLSKGNQIIEDLDMYNANLQGASY